ncbi:MAG: glyoxalase [Acidimicrobiales bacterium]
MSPHEVRAGTERGASNAEKAKDSPRGKAISAFDTAESPVYRITRLDHVQLAMPPDRESQAESFYAGILGLELHAKPPALAARGGCWFEKGDLKVLGVEADFRPALKAHPGLLVEGLDGLVEALTKAGHPVSWDAELLGVRRCYVADPFGNRIELIEA